MSEPTTPTLGILVGGGPAPGINGVISAATIEARNRGLKVIGLMHGFEWLVKKDISHIRVLDINDVSRVHLRGGSILRTSRENPTTDPGKLKNVIDSLGQLGINYLVTIGGDDTAYSSQRIEAEAAGRVKVVHVPKTIDNDLPLPGLTPTFGFTTAVQVGVGIVATLMEDARTTARWYIVVAMGRKAGHLALGIGKAAGATVTLIGEDFRSGKIPLREIGDILEGSILKRETMGRPYGVAVVAEGLAERMDPAELEDLKDVERDEHGHIRLAEVDLGRLLQGELKRRLKARGLKRTIVSKDVGYELRCAAPVTYDLEYTRDLGYGAVKLLMSGGTGAMVTIQAGRLVPMYFAELLDPATGKTRVRYVNTETESYEAAAKYMIRLNRPDFEDPARLAELARVANTDAATFEKQFGYLGRRFRW
ncbi:MAG: diphosphate--fructose-6-phosphate 1-phosphotransferase [bacterium]